MSRADRTVPGSTGSEGPSRDLDHGRLFWFATALGWVGIGFGVWTALQRSGATRPAEVGAWIVGLALAHDLVLAPLIAGVAIVAGRRLPPRVRGPVTVGAIVSGALVLVSLPPLLGARVADNPSLLPRDYGAGLVVSLVVAWAVVVVGALAVRRRRRDGGRRARTTDGEEVVR